VASRRLTRIFSFDHDAQDPIATSTHSGAVANSEFPIEGPVLIEPNFDFGNSPVQALLGRAMADVEMLNEQVVEQVDLLNERAKGKAKRDLDFLLDLDRASKSYFALDGQADGPGSGPLGGWGSRVEAALTELGAWGAWQIRLNSQGDVKGDGSLGNELKLRLDEALRRAPGGLSGQAAGAFPSGPSGPPWKSRVPAHAPSREGNSKRLAAVSERAVFEATGVDSDWGNIYFDPGLDQMGDSMGSEPEGDFEASLYMDGGFADESLRCAVDLFERKDELDGQEADQKEEEEAGEDSFELRDTVIAGRWRRRRKEGGEGNGKEEIYFDASQ